MNAYNYGSHFWELVVIIEAFVESMKTRFNKSSILYFIYAEKLVESIMGIEFFLSSFVFLWLNSKHVHGKSFLVSRELIFWQQHLFQFNLLWKTMCCIRFCVSYIFKAHQLMYDCFYLWKFELVLLFLSFGWLRKNISNHFKCNLITQAALHFQRIVEKSTFYCNTFHCQRPVKWNKFYGKTTKDEFRPNLRYSINF